MSDYGTVLESGAVRFERMLPGPIERVWEHLVQAEQRATWLAAGEMDLRPGGAVTLEFRNSELTTEPAPEKYRQYDGLFINRGRVLQVEAPRLLTITWDEPANGGSPSEVTFELSPVGSEVKLVLTHRKLANHDAMVSVASGWHTHLGILAANLCGSEPWLFWSTCDRLANEYAQRIAE